jgi:hypothetical protein
MAVKLPLRKRSTSETSPAPASDPIQQVGEEIVATYQQLEEAWKKAESILAAAHVPVDVKVKVGNYTHYHHEEPYGDSMMYLGYVKLKNQWRICYITETTWVQQPDDDVECRPITECPVELRLEMMDWFPKLHEKVIKVTKDYVPKIKEKVAAFENTLRSI